MNFIVIFLELVIGVDVDDFMFVMIGIVIIVNGDDDILVIGVDSWYIVIVDIVLGMGDFGVDFVDDDSIIDVDGNVLVEFGVVGSIDGSYMGGELFIVDNIGLMFITSENWVVVENIVIVVDVNVIDGNGNDINIIYLFVGGVD